MLDHIPGIPCPKPAHVHKERKGPRRKHAEAPAVERGLAFPKPTRVFKARKPIKKVNKKRKAEMYERNFGKRGAAVREMPCLAAASGDCKGYVQAAHVDARGMGSVGGDRRSLVPLCSLAHHPEQERSARDFEQNYQVDLHAEADRIARELDARGLP